MQYTPQTPLGQRLLGRERAAQAILERLRPKLASTSNSEWREAMFEVTWSLWGISEDEFAALIRRR